MTESMARPELGKLEVGQKVVVRRSTNDMRRRPDTDRYISAEVTKVGRVWVEVAKYPDMPVWSAYRWRMRMDTQNEATQYSGSNASFATLDQHAWDETRDRALGVIREHGLRVETGSRWSGREIELAHILAGNPPVYPRFLGIDDSGSCVWERADGRWCWGDDPYHAARQVRTFEPDRYVEKYGAPTSIEGEAK